MVHTSSEYGAVKGAVGCIAKQIIYKGVASHAGGSPWNGHNALYAATCGINAINAIRETFKESDIIRVHPIITNGGAMVNAIPEKTVLESYVRGSTFDGILAANKKVNQALCGAALSINTNVEIIDTPGYAPLINDKGLMKVFADAAKIAVPEYEFHEYPNHMNAGSTDMGDLCSVMPVIHPYAGGATGNSHGNNYQIADPVAACVGSAKIQLAVLKILLDDGAAVANEITKNYKAPFASKEDYLSFMDGLARKGDRITYTEDGIAKVDIN
jgi:metal-dependent amidase/aminoacylase/carboxypeptidase family protein